MVMPLPYRPLEASDPNPQSSGAELVTVDGRSLPLVGARLTGDARGGLARLVLEQRFENRFEETLRVRYRMPLPADGAVSGYEFEVGGRRIAGRVHRRQEARERFEVAVAAGQTAALLEQERADVFTQELGNILPGEAIIARITIDQRLAWLAGQSRLRGGSSSGSFEGEWELRFPTVIGPRYIGASDSEADAQATHIAVAPGQIPARVSIDLAIRDELRAGRQASSPSHELRVSGGRVALRARQGERLDRDIVVRWPVAAPEVGLSLDTARGEGPEESDRAYGLLTIVPPAPDARARAVPRDLIILLDTSGSMEGAPLDAAKAVVSLLIESLGEGDRLELIEFSDRPRRYREAPLEMTVAAQRGAIAWVQSRVASGGTEMGAGVREALRALRQGAQRQVVVVTDGYVGGEAQIVRILRGDLPGSCRLHVLGVGAAVNRSLSAALARAGRGVEVLASAGGPGVPREDPERAAERLIAHTRAPVLVDVALSGSALVAQAPEQLPDVFAGAPIVAALALRPEGGELVVRGARAGGAWEQRVRVPAQRRGEGNPAIAKLFARECVADLEARSALREGDAEEIDREIEALGVGFQISTRLTSWVAIDERRRAEAGPGRTEDVPQELPYGTSAASFGLRAGVPELLEEPIMGADSIDPMALLDSSVLGRMQASAAVMPEAPRRSKTLLAGKRRMAAPAPEPEVREDIPAAPRPSSAPAKMQYSSEYFDRREAPAAGMPSKQRSPWFSILLVLLVLAAIAALLWWLVL